MDLGLVHLSRLPRPTRLSLRGGVCLLKKSAQGSACVSVQVQPGKDVLSPECVARGRRAGAHDDAAPKYYPPVI